MVETLETRRHLAANPDDAVALEEPLPAVSIGDVTVTEVLGNRAEVEFTLTLTSPPIDEFGNLAPRVTFTTSDGTAVAGEDYVATSGVATFLMATTVATARVTVIGDFEEEGPETFTVTLSDPRQMVIGDGVGVATILNATVPPPVSFGGPREPLTFTRAGRGAVSVSLRGPGTAAAFFAPGAAEPGRIDLDGTTSASSLNVIGDAALPEVFVNGSLRSLGGRTTDLAGKLRVSGTLSRLILDDVAADSSVRIAGGDRPLTVTADQVNGLNIDSAAPIRSLRASDWLGGGLITTPALASLTVAKEMSGSIRAGAIGRVTAASISGADVRAEQSIGSITATGRGLVNARVFAGVNAALDTLPDSPDDFVNPAARIGSVSIRTPQSTTPGFVVVGFSGSAVAAPMIGKLKLGSADGSLERAVGAAAQAIRSLSATVVGEDPLRLTNLQDPADSRTVGTFVLRLL